MRYLDVYPPFSGRGVSVSGATRSRFSGSARDEAQRHCSLEDSPSFKVILVGESGVGKTSLIRRITRGVFTDYGKPTVGVDFASLEYSLFGVRFSLDLWDTAGQERLQALTTQFFRGSHAVILCSDLSNKESVEKIPFHAEKVVSMNYGHSDVGLNHHDRRMRNADNGNGQRGDIGSINNRGDNGSINNRGDNGSNNNRGDVGSNRDRNHTPQNIADCRGKGKGDVRKMNGDGLVRFAVGCKYDTRRVVPVDVAEKIAMDVGAEYWETSSKADYNVTELFDRVAATLFEEWLLKRRTEREAEIEEHAHANHHQQGHSNSKSGKSGFIGSIRSFTSRKGNNQRHHQQLPFRVEQGCHDDQSHSNGHGRRCCN